MEATGGERTSEVQIAPGPAENAEEHAAPERAQDAVLVGYSRVELRTRNGLRRMLDTEDGQVLSRIVGVYGFANHLSLSQLVQESGQSSLGAGIVHATPES